MQGALAEALANIEKFDEALKHVDKVIATNPKSPLGYNLRARIRILQDKLDDAITDLNEVLKLDPNNVGALLLRGQALAQQDKFEEAKADVDRAIKLQPELTQALLLRSMLRRSSPTAPSASTPARAKSTSPGSIRPAATVCRGSKTRSSPTTAAKKPYGSNSSHSRSRFADAAATRAKRVLQPGSPGFAFSARRLRRISRSDSSFFSLVHEACQWTGFSGPAPAIVNAPPRRRKTAK